MNRIWWVARREYVEHVRTKSFIVGILMLPLMFAGSIGVSALLDKASDTGPVMVVDAGAGIAGDLPQAYKGEHPLTTIQVPATELDGTVERYSAEVLEKTWSGLLVLTAGITGTAGEARFYTANPAREEPRESLMAAVNETVRKRRLVEAGIDHDVFEAVFSPVASRDFDLKSEGASEVSKKARTAKSFIPMIFVYLMFIGILSNGQHMLTSTVEEKSNRVMEVLLSSVSPLQLMTGKMLGLALVSLTLFAVWMAGGAYAIVKYDLQAMVSFDTLGYFLVFYFLGFLIYSAVMGAMGSLCNELKDAQNMMTPMIMVMVLPLTMMFWVGQNPDHVIGRVLSFIPLFTPFLMMNRISSALPPGPVEIALSIVALVGGIAFTVWLAARVFRVGVLLYGKPPAPREVLRWLREA
jgi:ABC-2 type transport system permease protein